MAGSRNSDGAPLEAALRKALDGSGYREMQRIDIRIAEGAIHLDGVVGSWSVKQIALQIVRRATPLPVVHDGLSVSRPL